MLARQEFGELARMRVEQRLERKQHARTAQRRRLAPGRECLARRGNGRIDFRRISAMDQHLGALSDETLGHREADAGGGAGDEDDLAC